MKRLLCLSVIALSLSAYSQTSFVVRPSLGNAEVTDGGGKAVSSSAMSSGQVIRVSVPVYNNSFAQGVGAGSGVLELDLGMAGSGLEVVEVVSGNNFSWDKPRTAADGHSYMTGRLVGSLPANYSGTETFVLKVTGVVSTRLRMRWIDNVPSVGKRADISTELQVQAGGMK